MVGNSWTLSDIHCSTSGELNGRDSHVDKIIKIWQGWLEILAPHSEPTGRRHAAPAAAVMPAVSVSGNVAKSTYHEFDFGGISRQFPRFR